MKTYKVGGMTCNGCVRSVERVVQAIDPGLAVKVDLESGALSVDGEHSEHDVRAAVERAGFALEGGARDGS